MNAVQGDPDSQTTRQVEYLPPSPQSIRDFAQTSCSRFARNDPKFGHPEVVGGLADFLTFYFSRLAVYANQGTLISPEIHPARSKGVHDEQ